MKRIYALLAALLVAAAPASFSPPDRIKLLAAAGFAGTKSCATGEPGWPRSRIDIEAVDLNGDGKPEAIVNEDNVACYGNTGTAFVIVARDAKGIWRAVGGDTGVAVVRSTKRGGWRDIEVGGPGFGRRPVLRWNGAAYR